MDIEVILDELPIITAVLEEVIIDTGVDVTTANATVNDVLVGKTFFAENRELKEGAIPSLGEQIYTPSEETQVINSGSYLSGNQTILPMQLMNKTVTTVGTFYAVDDEKQGYKSVNVNIPQLQETTYIPSEEQQIIQAGQYLSGNQTIQAVNLSEKTITSSGEYLASNDNVMGYKKVTVNVPIVLQDKTITSNGIVTADEGYTGLREVNVNVPAPTEPYIEETYNESGDLINAVLHGYTKIRNYAFYGCFNLALTSLPSEITSIGGSAFYYCTKLALTSLPSGITNIGNAAFSSCSNLALTSLPSEITSIGNNAFSSCFNLALTSLPSEITSIGGSAFYYCTKLALTSLPSGITNIGSQAFRSCVGLTSITFQGTPTTISNNVFQGCTNLLTINVPWSQGAVANAPWGATLAVINYNYVGA